MSVDTGRLNALLGFSSVALGAAALAAGPARAEAGSSVVPQGVHALPELMERLRKAPRRRDFKTVPMILDRPDLWDDRRVQAKRFLMVIIGPDSSTRPPPTATMQTFV